MNERHPDRESYLYICNELIEKEICNYCDVYKGSLELIPNWKEEIWDKYVQLSSCLLYNCDCFCKTYAFY